VIEVDVFSRVGHRRGRQIFSPFGERLHISHKLGKALVLGWVSVVLIALRVAIYSEPQSKYQAFDNKCGHLLEEDFDNPSTQRIRGDEGCVWEKGIDSNGKTALLAGIRLNPFFVYWGKSKLSNIC
jgi:hypothetical protein